MKTFFNESMFEILSYLNNKLKQQGDFVEIEVLNPDTADNTYAGTKLEINSKEYIYRGYKSWIDLSEVLYCKLLTPIIATEYTVVLRFKKLNIEESFHQSIITKEEKYGNDSPFSLINKNEEPAFLSAYLRALSFANINNRDNILNLGINRADEFEVIEKVIGSGSMLSKNFYGIDFSPSAIARAKNTFPSTNFTFICDDLNNIDNLNLPKMDLIITIGTLQSSSLNFKPYFMSLVQNYLNKEGSIIIGFPNTRWMGGEMVYGAKIKNYSFSDQSLLYKDVFFCKKYLQQKKFKVILSGKNYLFLTATRSKE